MARKNKKTQEKPLPIGENKLKITLKDNERIDGPWIVSGSYRRLIPPDER